MAIWGYATVSEVGHLWGPVPGRSRCGVRLSGRKQGDPPKFCARCTDALVAKVTARKEAAS